MQTDVLISNLTNPTLLFFILGFFAVLIKSDLEVPGPSMKFISLYLLLSIGFKGGQELSHTSFDIEMVYALSMGLALAIVIPIYVFFILKRTLQIQDAGAIAATYGSVSAVTFVSSVGFLEFLNISYSGYMVTTMALMEAPAIIIGVALIGLFEKGKSHAPLKSVIRHSITNGSVLIILGSLFIGFISDSKQAEGIKPFTTDIFKGFLAIFLLDMGMETARKISSFVKSGGYLVMMALLFPVINGGIAAVTSHFLLSGEGNRFMISVLAASASYIAVPAAMKHAAPKADPGLFIPMALGVTFPFNITIGFPLYLAVIRAF